MGKIKITQKKLNSNNKISKSKQTMNNEQNQNQKKIIYLGMYVITIFGSIAAFITFTLLSLINEYDDAKKHEQLETWIFVLINTILSIRHKLISLIKLGKTRHAIHTLFALPLGVWGIMMLETISNKEHIKYLYIISYIHTVLNVLLGSILLVLNTFSNLFEMFCPSKTDNDEEIIYV